MQFGAFFARFSRLLGVKVQVSPSSVEGDKGGGEKRRGRPQRTPSGKRFCGIEDILSLLILKFRAGLKTGPYVQSAVFIDRNSIWSAMTASLRLCNNMAHSKGFYSGLPFTP